MRLLLIFFLISAGFQSLGQVTGPVPPIIQKLADCPKPVNTHSFSVDAFIPDLPYPFQKTGATFVRTHSSLLALVNGTGRVYALDTSRGLDNWIRIDSTFFSGYNMGCYTFYADSTVWSFGGYGLWNNNGHLRYYSPEKFEWEVKPLNRELPHIFSVFDLYQLDERDRSLINTLLEASLQGKTCSIDTINALLGVTNKSLEIQKRQRSDALNAINKKLSVLLGTDTDTIQRSRSPLDRRSFEYAVNSDLLSPLQNLMGQ